LLRGLELPHYTAFGLGVLGRVAAEAGDLDRAYALHVEAAGLVDAVVSPWFAAFTHQCLASTMERTGDDDTAERLHRRVLVEDPAPGSGFAREPFLLAVGGSPSARSLIALGIAAARRGAMSDACRALLDGVERARRDADHRAVARGIEDLATVAVAAGAAGFGATLLGSAEGYREAVVLDRTGHDERVTARVAATARTALPATGFRRAVERGRTLTPEDVLAEMPTGWPGRPHAP
jgi:hypothetical protein